MISFFNSFTVELAGVLAIWFLMKTEENRLMGRSKTGLPQANY